MEVKEAIEFIEEAIKMAKKGNIIPTLQEMGEDFKKIILLLQQGEKFEAMWGELEKQYGTIHHFYPIKNERFCTGNEVISYLSETMYHIKKKYFPKQT